MSALVTFRISGTAMGIIDGSELSSDPQKYDGGTQGAIDALAALEGAIKRVKGRGHSYVLVSTFEGALTIADYLATMAQAYGSSSSKEIRTDALACRTAATHIRSQVGKARAAQH